MRLPRFAYLFFVGVFGTLFVQPVITHAQKPATIHGTVTDPSGAAVSGAEITAQAIGMRSVALREQTGADGSFSVALAPGKYRVSIRHAAFALAEQELALTVGETRAWDVRLQLEKMSSKVVVSDTAEPTTAQTAPDLVDVITKEQIDQRQAIWMIDMLASEQGVSFDRGGPFGGVTGLFLDGGNSNYTKVLVDGTPVNQPGGAIDFSNFTLLNVDKIEIVHGASSALYGSDAMDGVVQILTHRGTTAVPQLTLEGDGGTFGTGNGGAQLSGLLGAFDYSAAGGYFSTEGQGPGDYFRDATASGNFGWKFSDTDSLRLALRNSSSDAGQPGQTLLPGQAVLGQHNDLHDFSANLTWNFTTGEHWQHQVSGFESRFQDNDFSPLFGSFVSKYNRAGVEGQSTYLFHDGELTAGYENEVEVGPTETRHNQAGYLEVRRQFGRRLTAVIGGRVEANGFFGTRFVPRVGASYALRDGQGFWGATRLRASYGQGIKEPEILPPDCSPQLAPEESRTVDAGFDQLLASDRIRFSATYFHNDFRNIVSFAFLVPNPNCPAFGGSFFNTESARADGANAAFDVKLTRWLSIAGNYTYDDSKVLVAGPEFDPSFEAGNRLFRRPLHSANLIANAHFLRMNWNLSGHYVGRRSDSDFISTFVNGVCQPGPGSPCITSNPSYVRWDFANSVNLGHGLSTVAHIENLFDKHYQDEIGYPALGYNYRLGLTYTWGGDRPM
jgi:vitamin B12 transporter